MEKYVNEDTVIKDGTYKSLPEELLICPICQLLMIEPFMCVSCMNNFCKKCTDNCNKKSKACPNGCKNATLKKQIEKNCLITKLKFRCIKGCGGEILFNDIKSHYDSNCLEKKQKEEKEKEEKKNKIYGKKHPTAKIKVLEIDEVTIKKIKKKESSYFTSKNIEYLIFIFV